MTACDTPPSDYRAPFEGELHSRAAYVINVESGDVMHELNANERLRPASTLKMMTLVTALTLLEGRESDIYENGLVEVPNAIWEEFDTDNRNTKGGSMSGVVPLQDNLTYRDLFHAMMLTSGNEAASIIAHNLGGGDVHVFVDAMNKKAAELGLSESYFTNAHGLYEPENYSTVHDLAVIARYGVTEYALFREIVGTFEYFMPSNTRYKTGYRIRNSNALMRPSTDETLNPYYREYVCGIKTGGLSNIWHYDEQGNETHEDGIANLVSMGTIREREYIVVTLEAPRRSRNPDKGISTTHCALTDHITLYDWLIE